MNEMAIFRRNKTWATDFTVNGQRYRSSLGTRDWREAQAREKELIARAINGKLSPTGQQFARLAFTEAADRNLEDRTAHLAARSIITERERLKAPRTFFGAVPLTRISADSIRQYVAQRKAMGLSNRTINMEVSCIARILRRAKRWHLVGDEIKPLPERRNVGRALTGGQKKNLLNTAASRPEWQIARLAACLAFNTTMRACEIRRLRWQDVDFMERTLTIRHSKTEAGERVIPLNADALAAVLELRDRAMLLFGTELDAEWYLFPHGEGQGPVTQPKNRPGPPASVRPDPTKPIVTWRTA